MLIMTLTNSVWAQVELSKPLPELGSSSGSSDDTPNPTDEIGEGTNRQNDQVSSASDSNNYEEFQTCLSNSIGDKAEVSDTEQIVKNCFNSSYAGNSVPIESPGDIPREDGGPDQGLPLLH
jgi:hypothetical protein